ncbi:MAG: hypothetical protein E7267_03890 [Lachnospiraceae bacterium]|nr:hypothetical protein [Lachnospiraceae bacterium]
MTIQEVISNVDTVKPNMIDDGVKIIWLNEVENAVYRIMKLRKGSENTKKPHLTIESDADYELLLPDEFSGIYTHYISAMIDYNNGETARYNNSMIMYNNTMNDFENYWYRTHPQVSDGKFGRR